MQFRFLCDRSQDTAALPHLTNKQSATTNSHIFTRVNSHVLESSLISARKREERRKERLRPREEQDSWRERKHISASKQIIKNNFNMFYCETSDNLSENYDI